MTEMNHSAFPNPQSVFAASSAVQLFPFDYLPSSPSILPDPALSFTLVYTTLRAEFCSTEFGSLPLEKNCSCVDQDCGSTYYYYYYYYVGRALFSVWNICSELESVRNAVCVRYIQQMQGNETFSWGWNKKLFASTHSLIHRTIDGFLWYNNP